SSDLAPRLPSPWTAPAFLCFGSEDTVLDLPPQVERKVGEEHGPPGPIVDHRVAELRVDEAAVEPNYEIKGCECERHILHEFGKSERPPQVRLVVAQQIVANQNRYE